MSELILNCCGLTCPEPLLRTRDALAAQQPLRLTVQVDNKASLENVTRFLTSHGFAVATTENQGIFNLHADRAEAVIPVPQADAVTCAPSPNTGKTLVLITSAVVGSGDDGLGGRMMKNFLATLPELGESLWRIILLNGGVTLAAPPSPALEDLQRLEASGVGVFVCGTCLEHFKLMEQKAVGQTTNMLDVVTSMQFADKVVRV